MIIELISNFLKLFVCIVHLRNHIFWLNPFWSHSIDCIGSRELSTNLFDILHWSTEAHPVLQLLLVRCVVHSETMYRRATLVHKSFVNCLETRCLPEIIIYHKIYVYQTIYCLHWTIYLIRLWTIGCVHKRPHDQSKCISSIAVRFIGTSVQQCVSCYQHRRLDW